MSKNYAEIQCRLVHNENGVFLVFPSNMETEVAAALFVGWENISSFGQYDNALKMIEPTFDSESVTLIKEDYEICVQKRDY
jgi:Uri superfamily endonuclease